MRWLDAAAFAGGVPRESYWRAASRDDGLCTQATSYVCPGWRPHESLLRWARPEISSRNLGCAYFMRAYSKAGQKCPTSVTKRLTRRRLRLTVGFPMIEDWAAFLDAEWRPVPRWALVAWATFYALFLGYVFHSHGDFLFIDLANLVVHEGGHPLFGWFGPTLGLWGGTLLQWLVPFLLAVYFFVARQKSAFVFCTFFFFENWLYTATYMADARAMVLPLVTAGGDSDYIEHDWNAIFSSLGVLQYDTTIAGVVRFLGWCGMIAVVVWFVWSGWKARAVDSWPLDAEGRRFAEFLGKRR